MKFLPTYLYIKQHSVTGKLYFGKTTKNPETYNGSGKHWLNHIREHGKEHVVTLWYCLFYHQSDCMQFALLFSEQQNIVESKDWLNLQYENGIDGFTPGAKRLTDPWNKGKTGLQHDTPGRIKQKRSYMKKHNPMKNPAVAAKQSEATKGKSKSVSHCENISKALKGNPKLKFKRSKKTKKLMSENNGMNKSVTIKGQVFHSMKTAMKHFGYTSYYKFNKFLNEPGS